jgi:DNA-binding response OmpR family regulator
MKKILIVDDSVDDRSLLMSFLTHNGFLCDEASSGKEALERIMVKDYDLIISDFQMPDGDGPWLASQVKESQLTPKFLLISSDAVLEGQNLFTQKKIDMFLSKPLDFSLLLNQINLLT